MSAGSAACRLQHQMWGAGQPHGDVETVIPQTATPGSKVSMAGLEPTSQCP